MNNSTEQTIAYRRRGAARQSERLGLGKAVVTYIAISVFTFVFARVYNLFGHGVTSPFMSWMFLIPLLGGALPLGLGLASELFPRVVQRHGWRLGFNLYNAGIATLAAGSLLRGIFEIAGTASVYTGWFFITGAAFAAAGLLALARK